MLGNVEFVAQEWPDSAQLQDALAAIHDRKLVPAHKLFATMSSGEFKKAGTMRIFSHRACLNSVSFFVPCILRADEI